MKKQAWKSAKTIKKELKKVAIAYKSAAQKYTQLVNIYLCI